MQVNSLHYLIHRAEVNLKVLYMCFRDADSRHADPTAYIALTSVLCTEVLLHPTAPEVMRLCDYWWCYEML